MKLLKISPVLLLILIAACGQLSKSNNSKEALSFGEKIDSTKIVPIAAMLTEMNGTTQKDFTISGKVTDVCKSEGCWMKLDENNGKQLYVDTKEKIFLPKDITGKEVIITGYAYQDTTTVDELRKDAKEDGKSQAEIDKITSPDIEVSFIAKGVKIK